jgi:ankyrin repeat protein
MDSLSSKSTPEAIRLALQDLPRGTKELDTVYEQAMKRIDGQEEGFRELAKQVLSWVTHAKRPITIAELRHALAVRDGAVELDANFIPEVETLVSICAGLITVDEQSDIIRWIHYTTQKFFERTWILWAPHAQVDIARVCLTYLLFDAFAAGFCSTDGEFEKRLESYPLYDYAARNWGHHVRAASTEVEQLVLDFFKSDAKMSSASQATLASERHHSGGYSQKVPKQTRGVHLAAYFGLREVMIAVLENGYNPNVKDTYCRTPLSWAAENGHKAVVQLLLAQDGIAPDSKDKWGVTPLSWAVTSGHEAVVKLLLATDGVDPGSKDAYGQTPLSRAAEKGHEAVVKLLLEKDGVGPGSKGTYGQTPLSRAAASGHETVVKLLLATDGIDPDSRDKERQTPLSWAAENGHEAVVRLLLEKNDVDPNSKGTYGQTPLFKAAASGHETVVKLLLATDGVKLDSRDKYGQTPLSRAAASGYDAVVKLLLATDGVELGSEDNRGQTPLSLAAANGHEGVVKLLLAKPSVDPEAKNYSGWTPLLWAARNGHEAVVKLLLTKDGVDPNSKDTEYGRTPLSRAAENGHQAVVKLLLATDGVDPDSKDNERQTPLSWAAENGHETVVRLLLAKDGVEIDSKDIEDGQTPFSRAAASGHEMVIKLLLAIDGVDPDSKDRYGQTPLSRAAENGHDAVVELLLAKDGVVSDSKDALFGRTPLLWAAENGHEAVVRLLVEKQSSVNADGPALLETALVGSYTYVLELLLAKYIDWVAQDKFEWLLDLKDASYRVADIISLLFEATSKSPWIAFERPNIDISKGKLNVDVHQPVCAHHVSSTDKREDPLSDPIAFHLKRDVMQGIVASFCGLAGAFPPLKDQPDELEYVKFAGAKASVTFGYENSESEMEDSRDDESSITDLV